MDADTPAHTSPGADYVAILQALVERSPYPTLVVDQQGAVLCSSMDVQIGPTLARCPHNKPHFSLFLRNCRLPAALAQHICGPEIEVPATVWGEDKIICFEPLQYQGKHVACLVEIRDRLLDAKQISILKFKQYYQELLRCIEISSDGFCVMAADTTVLYVNRTYESITKLKPSEVVGHTMRNLVKRGMFDKSVTEQILRTRKPASLALNIATGKNLLVSGVPLLDGNGNVTRIVCCVRDVTELNRLQLELSASEALKTRYEEEIADLKKYAPHTGNLIFRSPAMKNIVDLVLRLRDVDSTILLMGESGSGKEVFADFIHQSSRRAQKPFLKINCGAIPEQLLESELFGYVRGAFTGAERGGKAGLFEAANHGTLLLDEVGEIPKSLQVKLLRVLQDKSVRRVGGTTSTTVDVRLVAATNRNLSKMVENGEFREDLFYRLNVLPITVPPLRERKEDILPLVQAFLERFCQRYGTSKTLHPSVIPLLVAYHWPGNVRELENIIERLVVTTAKTIIRESELPQEFLHVVGPGLSSFAPEGATLRDILDRFEASVLRACFAKYRTTRAVASALGINQSTVVRKVERYNMKDVLCTRDDA